MKIETEDGIVGLVVVAACVLLLALLATVYHLLAPCAA